MAYADMHWIFTEGCDVVVIMKNKAELVFKIWDMKTHHKETIQGQKSSWISINDFKVILNIFKYSHSHPGSHPEMADEDEMEKDEDWQESEYGI